MVTLVVFHHVANYDVWTTVFDEHEDVRRGIKRPRPAPATRSSAPPVAKHVPG